MRTVKWQVVGMVATFAVLLSLAGCGGGGDGEGTPANRLPSANAGPDQTVDAGSTVTLDGSGSSDSDGTIASYLWEQPTGPAASLSNTDQASASFVAPQVDSTVTLTFRLTVTDDDGATASDDVSVTIQGTPANQAPNANAGPDRAVDAGSTVTLDGSGSSDSDGTIVSYLWEQTTGPTVSLSNPAQASASFVASQVEMTITLTFRLTVTDDDGATASDDASVTIQPQTDGPEPFVLDVSRLDDPDSRLQ